MRKLRLLWHSDPAQISTGFGNYTKYILSYLYKTGKYEIANYACGVPTVGYNDGRKTPWRVYGSIPLDRPDIVNRANQDPGGFGRALAYGEVLLEDVVKDFKPDVFITDQDWWGSAEFAVKKFFWNKIPCIAHWTLDSIPILDDALNNAHKVNHHYVWAKFGEEEFHRLAAELESKLDSLTGQELDNAKKNIEAYKRVKTISGCVNNHKFKKLSDYDKIQLREIYGFGKDTFIISTGSRNQLRKQFGQQIEAFKLLKKNNPEIDSKLIFWTDVREGWSLLKHCQEYGVEPTDVLTAWRCQATGEVFYVPVKIGTDDQVNPRTGQKTVKPVGMSNFATEDQLNEFFNLSDVFMLHISSGGFELFLSQAKLVELPTIANSYSCFSEQVGLEKGTLITDETYYYEIGSGFKKATASPYSIYKNLIKIHKMTLQQRREIGKKGRQFVLDNYSIEKIGKQWEDLLDTFPLSDYDFKPPIQELNPNAQIPNIPDNKEYVLTLYQRILGLNPADTDDGRLGWERQLAQGQPRVEVETFFRQTAQADIIKKNAENLENDLGPEDASRRVLITIPESLGDCILVSALLKDARELYHDKVIYVATKPEYFDVFTPLINKYIDKVIIYRNQFDDNYHLTGAAGHKKIFQVMLSPHFATQRMISYLNNADDKSKIELEYK